jgi:tRNA-Thr(GGU) m(6)t(6)A37 methyltransferase TsaA
LPESQIAGEITYRPIGIVHSPFREPYGTPIQSVSAQNAEGVVEVFPEYAAGLEDIDGFSHIILIYHFHLSKGFSLMVKPFLDNPSHGIFACRAPARPNPIGISIVRLTRAEKDRLYIQDVDILDGTPLLDIKPYVPEFDNREADRKRWLEGNLGKLNEIKDDGRFALS